MGIVKLLASAVLLAGLIEMKNGFERHGAVLRAINSPASRADATSTVPSTSPVAASPLRLDPARLSKDEVAAYIVRTIKDASTESGVPMGILYGIWKAESGEVYGDRGGAGGCGVVEQYEIRDHWNPGNGARNTEALKRIAASSGWDWRTVQGSCGKSTMEVNAKNFGGCIGPMQITPSEWVEESEFADKNPLDLHWAMHSTAERLKRHHDEQVRADKNDYSAWEWAIRRYLGRPEHKSSLHYYAAVVKRWQIWHPRFQRNDGSLEAYIAREVYHRDRKDLLALNQ